MPRKPQGLISPQGLAEFCGVPIATVYRWNARGTGPRRLVVGKHVRYRVEDVEAWLDARAAEGPAVDPLRDLDAGE
jgi:predicted DNA-binding transcriptional regulator AlpA